MAQKPRPRKVSSVSSVQKVAPIDPAAPNAGGLSAGAQSPTAGMFDTATGLTLPNVARANDGGRFRQYPQYGQLSRAGLLSTYGTPVGDGSKTSMRVYNPDTISLAEYDEMALYPVIRSCLLGYSLVMQTADFSVSCPDSSMKALIEAQFLPVIPQILRDMLMPALSFGWSDGEILWETRYNVPVEVDGPADPPEGDPLSPQAQDMGNSTVRVYPYVTAIKDVVPIANTSVTLRQTPQGDFAGLVQWTWGQQFIQPSKLLHLPMGGLFRNPYGQAMTKPCFPFWYWVRFLFEMGMVGVERGAAPPIVGYAPPTKITAGTDQHGRPVTIDAADYMMQQLGNLRSFATAVFPKQLDANGKDLYSVEELPLDLHVDWIVQFITLCNQQMMLGMFWPDKLLQGGDVGSYALAKEHTDLFSLAVKAMLDVVLKYIIDGPLKQFVRFNDRNAPDATINYGAPNIEAMQALSASVVQAIVSGQALVTQNQDKVLVPDWKKLADDLGIPYSIVRRSDGRDAFGNPLQPGMSPDDQDHMAAQNGGKVPPQQPPAGAPGDATGQPGGQYQGFDASQVPAAPSTPGYNKQSDQIAFADEADPLAISLTDDIDEAALVALAATTGPALGGTGAFHTGGTHRVAGPSAANPTASYHYEPGPAVGGSYQYALGGLTHANHAIDTLEHIAKNGPQTSSQLNYHSGPHAGTQDITDLKNAGYVRTDASGTHSITASGINALHKAGNQFAGETGDYLNSQTKAPVGNLLSHALSSPSPAVPTNESSHAQKAFSAANNFETTLNILVGHHGAGTAAQVAFVNDPWGQEAVASLRQGVAGIKRALTAANKSGNTQLASQLKAEADHYSFVRDVLVDAAARGRSAIVNSPVGGSLNIPAATNAPALPTRGATQATQPATAATTTPALSADEQKVVSYLAARHAKAPGVAVHFDSIKAATKIPQAQLRPIIDGLETNGHVAKHSGSAGLRTGLSKYTLTGSGQATQGASQPATATASPAPSTASNTGTPAATAPATPAATPTPAVTPAQTAPAPAINPVQQDSIDHHILHALANAGPAGGTWTGLRSSVLASANPANGGSVFGGKISNLVSQGHVSYTPASSPPGVGTYKLTPQGAAAIANLPNPQPLPPGTTVNAPAQPSAVAPGSALHHAITAIAQAQALHGGNGVPTANIVRLLATMQPTGVTMPGNLVQQLVNNGLVVNFNGGVSLTPTGLAALRQNPAINQNPTNPAQWTLGGGATTPQATQPATSTPASVMTAGSAMHHALYDVNHMTGANNTPTNLASLRNMQTKAGPAGVTITANDYLQLEQAGYINIDSASGTVSMTPSGKTALGQLPGIHYGVGSAWSLAGGNGTPSTPAPQTAPQPPAAPAAPAATHVPGTSVSVSADEQKVIAYLTGRHAKKPGTHVHFDSIKNAVKIPQAQLAPIVDGLEQKGLLVKHPGSAGLRTGLSSYVLTGAAANSAMTPHATGGGTTTPANAPVTPDVSAGTNYHAILHTLNNTSAGWMHSSSLGAHGTSSDFSDLETAGYVTKHGKGYKITPEGVSALSGITPATAKTPPADPYADAFNGPAPGGYAVGPNSSFIHYGAAAGGGLPGAPVHTVAIRGGKSTLPLNLNDPGPAPGSQPHIDAQQYPDRNHAAAFGMTYQGPTGNIVTCIHGSDGRALHAGTVSGLRPGNTNYYGYGLYTWRATMGHSGAQGYTNGTNFVMELHTGQCIHTDHVQTVLDKFKQDHPVAYAKLSHDEEKAKAAACLQYGYSTIVKDYGIGSQVHPSYIVLDPSRCRIKHVVDNSGNALTLPNGKMSPAAPKSIMARTAPYQRMSSGKIAPQGAWFGKPDLAAVKDPRLVARNKSVGADPNTPLSDNGYNAVVEIGKHAPAGMVTKSRVDQARDVTRLILPVRSAGSPETLTSILDDGELISNAELKARHQAALKDPSPQGQALASKYGLAVAAAPNNPVDPVLGLDKTVLMTYGGPTPYSTYGDYAMVFKKEVLNTPGAKVGIHSPTVYNANAKGAAAVSNLNVDEWNKHEIDAAEADEVMAFQLAGGFPVTQATKNSVQHGTSPASGFLRNPADYIDGAGVTASQLSEVHIPTSVSAHHISHILTPSKRFYQPDQDKPGDPNMMHNHWKVMPGLHDSLKGSFTNFSADYYANANPHFANDGQRISLDGLPLTMRKVSTPGGRSSWKFEVSPQASPAIPLRDHLETMIKNKGYDIKVIETNHQAGSPHQYQGKGAYSQICYQQI